MREMVNGIEEMAELAALVFILHSAKKPLSLSHCKGRKNSCSER